jgi:5,10-methylenetetrahydromethanopterin reductase
MNPATAPMRTSFAHIPAFGLAATVDLIQRAEAWGFDGAWVPDQAFYLDPYPVLTAAGLATSRITLGVGVTNAAARHPLLTARLAATVAEAAPGRMRLGLGTGNRREYLQPLGYSSEQGAQRCGEAVRVIRSLLAGERVDHRSDLLTAAGVRLAMNAAPMPLYVAGIAQRILTVAGEVADGAIVGFASEAALATAMGQLKSGRANGDLRAEQDVVAWNIAIVTDEPAAEYDRIRPFIAHKIAPASRSILRSVGFDDEVVERIRADYWALGPERAAAHVTDDMVDVWSWIGTPSQIADRMRSLRALGITEVCVLSIEKDLDRMTRNLEAFATQVASQLAD